MSIDQALDRLCEAFGNDWTPQQGDAMDKVREVCLDLAAQLEAARSAIGPIAAEHKARGLTAQMIENHYPETQHQPEECELCHYVFKIAAEALGGTTDNTRTAAGQSGTERNAKDASTAGAGDSAPAATDDKSQTLKTVPLSECLLIMRARLSEHLSPAEDRELATAADRLYELERELNAPSGHS